MARRERIPFGVFWEHYGLKRNKRAAEKAWERMSAKDQWAAFSAVQAYREDCMKRGVAMKYAQGWLNDRRWEDEIPAGDPQAAKEQEDVPTEMEIW